MGSNCFDAGAVIRVFGFALNSVPKLFWLVVFGGLGELTSLFAAMGAVVCGVVSDGWHRHKHSPH
jgi:hypothetical protein